MKLTEVPNLRAEDFPSQQQWITRLFVQLNPFIQSVNQVLNGGIDYVSNIKTFTKDYEVNSLIPFSFVWPFSDVVPADVTIARASKGSAQTPTILVPAWSFDITTKVVSVSSIIELSSSGASAPSGSYQFKLRATV